METPSQTSTPQKPNHEIKGTISIWLDAYDEMFSDFDPRPYAKRTISDDFILQVRKVSRGRYHDPMALKLLFPSASRNADVEDIVSKRLQEYFTNNYEQLLAEKKTIIRKGILLSFVGVVFLLVAGYLSFLRPETYAIHFLLVLFEPAGWFTLWMGLDHLTDDTGKNRKELNFFAHMARATIEFYAYD